ncbi:serine hydrolase [Lentibacillus sp. CBA3610]|uniref:serine hydrolase n=1 Tax=Lentibacillus sp. CBA3610 TaxID=2518176 RepID=UPI0015956056|nr:serine hydrolase [Lentibacillus sp. CBA3610]QKY70374.1 serine hydrolase [Lentibacillus sp. CBA3610]
MPKLMKQILMAMTAIACFILLGFSGQWLNGQTDDSRFETLEDEVMRIVDEASDEGDISISIETSEGEINVNETEVYSAASTIKVPILVEAIRQAEEGILNLDEKIGIDSSDIVGGGGILNDLSENQSMTLRDLLTLMIIVSDNSATNMIIDRVGMDAVNETCLEMGCEQTELQRYMMDFSSPLDNLTTSKDMAGILKAIDEGNIVSEEGQDEILKIMREQKLAAGLPAHATGATFASKGGSLSGPPQIRHDVALVTQGNKSVYAAVLTSGLFKPTARSAMNEIGEKIADYLNAAPPPSEPDQYATDFTEYETGEQPDDWSTLWRDSSWTVLDEPRRLEHLPDGGRRALVWDKVGEVRGDVEVSSVVRASGVNNTLFQQGLHMSGSAGDEDFYYIDMRSPDASSSANRVRINEVQNGSFSLLGSAELPFTVEEDTWYQVVLQRDGDKLRTKVWPYGEEEPDDWQVEVTDDSLDWGWIGLGHFSSGTVNDWAYVGVGTAGESAPRAPDDLFEPEDPEVDKTELQMRVDEINAENLNENDYTEESWQALQDALAAAENVLNDPDAIQSDVDAALAALNEARDGLEEVDPISASSMITSVESFAEEGAFESDDAVRSLITHLTAVSRYEENNQAEKVISHTESFKQLLDHQEENEMISDEAYDSLYSDAESLIENWQ